MIKEDKLNELMLKSSTSVEDVIDATYISDEHKGLIEALYNKKDEEERITFHEDCGGGNMCPEDDYLYTQAELKSGRVQFFENKILIKGGIYKLLNTYKDQVVQLTTTVKGLVELMKENK